MTRSASPPLSVESEPTPQAPGDPSSTDRMIRVENLGKRFKIYRRPSDRLIEWATGGRRVVHSDFWAVRGVSFEVPRGRCLGIVGANGSGKSTLLKMITGALHPTEGTFSVRGRVLSLIELGTGLNPLMTGRQNIVNAARLLGFPVDYARQRMQEIEAFAEIGEFFDRQVQVYSTGMRVRLAFSMFACFRPEVFIVDEALSVGDVFFQQKCAARLRELLDGGMTMLFVSHDQGAVLNLCDRAILLDHGRAVFEGLPQEVVNRYAASLHGKSRFAAPRRAGAKALSMAPPVAISAESVESIAAHDVMATAAGERFGAGDVRIAAVRVTSSAGVDTLHANMGETLTFHLLVESFKDVHDASVGLQLVNRFNHIVFAAGTRQLGIRIPDLAQGDRLIVRFELTLDLAPGQYTFGVGASTPSEANPGSGFVLDRVQHLGPIRVGMKPGVMRPFYGVARLPLKATVLPPADPGARP